MHKKIKLALIIVASVTVIGTSIWFGVQKFNRTKVEVYRVEELKQMIWGESSSLEGIITSNVSQKVQLSENQIVQEVFVQEGQEVKAGTPLLSYDMTLVHINLETEKLNLRTSHAAYPQPACNLGAEKLAAVPPDLQYIVEIHPGTASVVSLRSGGKK